VLHGRSSQTISAGAEMPAGENRRDIRCLETIKLDVEVVATWAGVVRGGGATQTCPSIVRRRTMPRTPVVIASLFVGLLASSAADNSNGFSRNPSPVVEGGSRSEISTARFQQRADRIVRKFLRGRIAATVAAGRIADLLDRQRDTEGRRRAGKLVFGAGDKRLVVDSEAIYGVLFQVESADQAGKIAELSKEFARILTLRAQLQSRP